MKYGIVFEYDLGKGICHLAREKQGEGKVALFDTEKEAQDWVDTGQVDDSVFDVNIIKFSVM